MKPTVGAWNLKYVQAPSVRSSPLIRPPMYFDQTRQGISAVELMLSTYLNCLRLVGKFLIEPQYRRQNVIPELRRQFDVVRFPIFSHNQREFVHHLKEMTSVNTPRKQQRCTDKRNVPLYSAAQRRCRRSSNDWWCQICPDCRWTRQSNQRTECVCICPSRNVSWPENTPNQCYLSGEPFFSFHATRKRFSLSVCK